MPYAYCVRSKCVWVTTTPNRKEVFRNALIVSSISMKSPKIARSETMQMFRSLLAPFCALPKADVLLRQRAFLPC